MEARDFVTVVSGLPRSGTSLLMQMLVAGGIPPCTDAARTADESNPRGYFEHEGVKRLKADAAWVAGARGKALKVIHAHLADLPAGLAYRVLFLDRRLDEVVASQRAMLAREGKSGAKLPDDKLAAIFARQVEQALAFLAAEPGRFAVLRVRHHDLVHDSRRAAESIAAFLGAGLDVAAMEAAVDPSLHRQRKA